MTNKRSYLPISFFVILTVVCIGSSFKSKVVREGESYEVRHYVKILAWDLWTYHAEPMSKNEHAKMQIDQGELSSGETLYEVVDGKVNWNDGMSLANDGS